jgi:hypothetical protein
MNTDRILGAFSRSRKAHFFFFLRSSYSSIFMSVRVYQRGSHLKVFREVWYWVLLRKSVEKIQIWLKSGKITGRFT